MSDWRLPCPKCKSKRKSKDGFGSMHSKGHNGKGMTSTYSHTCGKCGAAFSKTYDYENKKIYIKLENKIVEEEIMQLNEKRTLTETEYRERLKECCTDEEIEEVIERWKKKQK